jgi:hypothetical protein
MRGNDMEPDKSLIVFHKKISRLWHDEHVTICHGLKLPVKDVLVKPCEKSLNVIVINNLN